MRKWLLVLVMAGFFVFPSLVSAQNKVSIESINVSLWPEYDKPGMLVISYIKLPANTSFPAQLDLRISADATLNTIAVGKTSDSVSDQGIKYTTKTDGDALVVSITATGPAIQFEYYDPGLKKDGNQRSYSYKWVSDYDVATFGVAFQEPFDATEFKSSLPLRDDGVHADNMHYYTSSVGAVPAGKALTFDVNYQKSTDALSVSRLQVQPVNVNENTPGRVSLNNYLPYIIGGLGLILIVIGLLYFSQSGRTGSKKPQRRQRSRAKEAKEEDIYCAQCGTRANSGDRFCRTCGSRIRQPEE